MPSNEEIDLALAAINRSPDAAAHQLANLRQQNDELRAALNAIRAFSQNIPLASTGSLKTIESVLNRNLA